MSAPARTILLLAALLAAPLAQALGLGGLTGNGAPGARLDAYVPLYLAPGEHATLRSVDVLPDAFALDDATPLADLVARIERDATLAYVHVTTNTPLRVDRLRFRLRVNTTRGAIVGRYALRVAATSTVPSTALRTARRVVQEDTRIVARSPQPVAAPVQASETRYGPVRSGESLWTIAKRIASTREVQATMRALHALNPEAFIGGDMNRLRVGVTLTLPAGASRTDAEVVDETITDSADTTTSSRITTSAGATQVTMGDTLEDLLQEEDAASATSAREPTSNDGAVTLHEVSSPEQQAVTRAALPPRDTALAQRLLELDTKFAAIRAKYGHPSSSAARVSSTTMPAAHSAATHPPRTTSHVVDAQTPRVEPVAKSPATSPPAEAGVPGWLRVGLVAGLLLLALLVALPRLQRRLVARRMQSKAADVRAADAGRRAEVARKAENRVRLESEIQGLLQRKQGTPSPPEPPPAASAPLVDTTKPPVSPFEQTLDALAVPQGSGLLENDREVAIDANIAHGRYAEAEVLLREVIKSHPRNVQAKLRLAEVYYITEKLDGFTAVASDLKDHHRGDLSDDEWQRVVRMGKIIAPDLALFSGPKAVGRRA